MWKFVRKRKHVYFCLNTYTFMIIVELFLLILSTLIVYFWYTVTIITDPAIIWLLIVLFWMSSYFVCHSLTCILTIVIVINFVIANSIRSRTDKVDRPTTYNNGDLASPTFFWDRRQPNDPMKKYWMTS